MRRLHFICALSLAAASPACNPASYPASWDDWGPSAGYAVVAGTVLGSVGAPLPTTLVEASGCAPPVQDAYGRDTTGADGRFRIELSLGPVGLRGPLPADTLSALCVVRANRDSRTARTIRLMFASQRDRAPADTVTLLSP